MRLVEIHVHRVWVVAFRTSNKFGRRLLFEGLNKLIHAYVHFKFCLDLVEILDRHTGKVAYGRVRVLGQQRCGLASQM